MDQDATWYGVGLGPGYIVLDGDPVSPPKKGTQPPVFGPCLLWPNGWMDQDATWYKGSFGQGRIVTWNPAPHPKRRTAPAPIFGPCLLWTNGHPSQLLL